MLLKTFNNPVNVTFLTDLKSSRKTHTQLTQTQIITVTNDLHRWHLIAFHLRAG